MSDQAGIVLLPDAGPLITLAYADALERPPRTGVFLFEDHQIARASFLLPENCRKVSTRAYLIYLEQRGWLASATDVERRAIRAGRNYSQLRFPPG